MSLLSDAAGGWAECHGPWLVRNVGAFCPSHPQLFCDKRKKGTFYVSKKTAMSRMALS